MVALSSLAAPNSGKVDITTILSGFNETRKDGLYIETGLRVPPQNCPGQEVCMCVWRRSVTTVTMVTGPGTWARSYCPCTRDSLGWYCEGAPRAAVRVRTSPSGSSGCCGWRCQRSSGSSSWPEAAWVPGSPSGRSRNYVHNSTSSGRRKRALAAEAPHWPCRNRNWTSAYSSQVLCSWGHPWER